MDSYNAVVLPDNTMGLPEQYTAGFFKAKVQYALLSFGACLFFVLNSLEHKHSLFRDQIEFYNPKISLQVSQI